MTLTRQSIHCLVLRQRRLVTALLAVACLLLSLVVPTSCVEPLTPEQKLDYLSKELTIRIYMPGTVPATKISGTVPYNIASIDPESRIYTLQVWMFNHADPSASGAALAAIESQTAVSYSEVSFNELHERDLGEYDSSGYYNSWNDIYEVKMMVPGYIMDRDANNMKFDFYVLANGPAIDKTVGRLSTRGELKAATFGTSRDAFGPTAPKYGVDPQTAINGNATNNGPGLPITGFFNKDKNGATNGVDISTLKSGQTLTPEQMRNMMPIVQLERAVAKLRFAFAKPSGMDGVQITKIELDGSLIPTETFVFPRESNTTTFELPIPTGQTVPVYRTDLTQIVGNGTEPLLNTTAIRSVSDPEALKSDSNQKLTSEQAKTPSQMDGVEYDAFLSSYTTSELVYLRESDKPISGKIYYKLSADGEEQSTTFNMSEITGYDATTTNFHRNHYWTVYAYFKGGGLYIKPVVLPWYVGGDYDFTTPGTAYVTISDKVESLFGYGWTTSTENRWYTAGKPVEWFFRRVDASSPTADDWKDWVHSQIVVAPGANIANTPIYANRIELHTNGFTEPLRLKLTNTTDFYLVIYHANTTGNAYEVIDAAGGAEIPVDIAAGGISYFYVAPKEGADHEGKTTGAYLVTANTDQKIPFNPGAFPGSNENTEIYFYSVSQDAFKGYYTSRPANIKAYGKKIEDGKEVIGEISL